MTAADVFSLIGLIILCCAFASTIITPVILVIVIQRLKELKHEVARLDVYYDSGPDDPDEGEPDAKPTNVVAFGRKPAA